MVKWYMSIHSIHSLDSIVIFQESTVEDVFVVEEGPL